MFPLCARQESTPISNVRVDRYVCQCGLRGDGPRTARSRGWDGPIPALLTAKRELRPGGVAALDADFDLVGKLAGRGFVTVGGAKRREGRKQEKEQLFKSCSELVVERYSMHPRYSSLIFSAE
jgi:hypothetical protein